MLQSKKNKYSSKNLIKIFFFDDEYFIDLTLSDPPIWVFHDVITESQIELMKRLAAPKLKRAIVRSPITGQFETAEYRISKRLNLNLLII